MSLVKMYVWEDINLFVETNNFQLDGSFGKST